MTEFTSTIRHSSISRAREITTHGTLAEAKTAAAAEFGDEFRDYEIVIFDTSPGRAPEIVSTRKVSDKKWIDCA